MSLSKSDINILSSYVNNWRYKIHKSHWSDILLSHFIGDLNKIAPAFIDNYLIYLCDGLFDELFTMD